MLWNLIQQAQLGDARDRQASLEHRVGRLEDDLDRISEVLTEVIRYLERQEGRDIDGDGRVG
jgi:BMFP domain-containing protein YqiC